MCGSVFPLSGKARLPLFYNCLTSLCRIKTHSSQWGDPFNPACGFISVGYEIRFGCLWGILLPRHAIYSVGLWDPLRCL
ncbi:hypothetical protein IX307_002737 [Bacteroides pyogenes]|nr:hypothetical protein [Bacteroides pyogenes]MBR8725377.1 hypothetical protein [Bacteroides pyogenes]MBR8737131.1 hypothetical protein [Bacteroides pyogenes]MBR8754545.1 hypothetical protein [Bacteroides pyogenes]MBR8788387.1 hypothetical protein [Bacteroides pyogenes]